MRPKWWESYTELIRCCDCRKEKLREFSIKLSPYKYRCLECNKGEAKMSEMHVMDRTGHTTVTWDQDNHDEVEVARTTFTQMMERGYRAFRPGRDGGRGTRMDTFDPTAEEMILVPQQKGG